MRNEQWRFEDTMAQDDRNVRTLEGVRGLQKRPGLMQLLVPRWPQWAGLRWRIEVSGDYAIQTCKLGCTQPLGSWITEDHNT